MPMFAWADGVANRLADAYRSGMTVNFVLATLAVIIGILFLPTGMGEVKWAFALVELLLLCGILAMTAAGSPGVNRSMRKTKTATTPNTGTMAMRRRAIKSSIFPLRVTPSEARGLVSLGR